jgi:hypothetical protein
MLCQSSHNAFPSTAAWFAAAAWLILVSSGSLALIDHSARPGRVLEPSLQWPLDSALVHSQERPALLMFAHPRCPCTQASLAELASIVQAYGNRIDIQVVFLCPADGKESWRDTALVREAKRLSAVKVVFDPEAVEARRFRATISGQVLIFDRLGKLLYDGGITAARGHAGENLGKSAVISLIGGTGVANVAAPIQFPTFGCALFVSQDPSGGAAR